jgi:hypothetical protein
MGVNATAWLNTDNADNVAEVVAILLGAEAKLATHGKGSYQEYTAAEVSGVNIVSDPRQFGRGDLRSDAKLQVNAAKLEGDRSGESAYLSPRIWFGHNVDSRNMPKQGIAFVVYLSSSPVRIALLTRLAQWFGGTVESNDSRNNTSKTYKRRAPANKYGVDPEDGKAWNAYQAAVVAIKPLTRAEVKRFNKVAAYKGEEAA